MWLLRPTEVALKMPVRLMNVATAALLVWHAARGVGLSPVLAVIAALPLALPPIVVGTRLMEAMGGNLETPFYALLLWTLSGLASTLVYVFVSCAQLTASALRYDLLVLAIPAGAVMAGLRHPAAAVRAGLAAATVVWALSSADDYRALAGEIRRGQWTDERAIGVAALDARGLTVLWGRLPPRLCGQLHHRRADYRGVGAAPADRRNTARATAARAPFIKSIPCAGGEPLSAGMWLCKPP